MTRTVPINTAAHPPSMKVLIPKIKKPVPKPQRKYLLKRITHLSEGSLTYVLSFMGWNEIHEAFLFRSNRLNNKEPIMAKYTVLLTGSEVMVQVPEEQPIQCQYKKPAIAPAMDPIRYKRWSSRNFFIFDGLWVRFDIFI